MSDELTMARLLRLSTVIAVMQHGAITRDDALELLNAPLSPSDPDAPVVDDRNKIDWGVNEIMAWILGGNHD